LAAKVQARALERFYCDLTFDPSGDFVPTEAGWSDEKWRRIVTAGNIKPE